MRRLADLLICSLATPGSTDLDFMLTTIGFSVLRAVARAVPPRLGGGLSRIAGRLHYHLAPAKRSAVHSNLAHVLSWTGQAPEREDLIRLTRRTFQSHGLLLYEWLREGADVTVDFHGLERLEQARAGGRGTVITTCHLGNWEVAAFELARRGFVLHVVTGEQLGRLGAAVRRHKATHGIHVVRPADGMRPLYRALRRGEIVVLLIDGDVYRRGRPTPFFATDTQLPIGAPRLARSTDAVLVPAAMYRTAGHRYEVRIQPRISTAGDDREVMRAALAALEPHIAAHPHQWCLFRPLWMDGTGRRAA